MIINDLLRKEIFPLGIGAWGLGGFAEKDLNIDYKAQIEAVVYMISKGMNLTEVNLWNSEGQSVEILNKAYNLSGITRDELVIHQAIYNHRNPKFKDAKNELNQILEIFETDYVDALEFNSACYKQYDKSEIFDFYHEALDSRKIKSVSVTNASLELLKELCKEFGDKMFAHELTYNFEIRANEDLGLTKFAEENSILNIVYQPLRRNRTAKRNWPLLVELAEKYGKTQNQIILNWLVSKSFLPLFKSQSKSHIDENLGHLNSKWMQRI